MSRLVALLNAVAGWRFFKPAVFIAAAMPLVLLGLDAYRVFVGGDELALTADPIKGLEHRTGQDALILLMVTLCVTPVRRLLKVNRVQSVRRMLGVWAFVYAFMHVAIYLVFDQSCYSWATCDFDATWQDILKRRFITVGMLAFTILAMLAITSTAGWVRRLKKKWQTLHRMVYVAAVAAVIHFIWIQKSDFREPLNYAYALGGLFAIRVYLSIQKRRARLPKPVTA